MVNEQYERAKRILSENKEGHNELTQLLIDKEVIFAEDVFMAPVEIRPRNKSSAARPPKVAHISSSICSLVVI